MQTQRELNFRKDIFWESLPWQEIYACGSSDDDVLPSEDRSYANLDLYSNPELLKKTSEIVLEETIRRLRGLEQKIMGEQPRAKETALKTAQEIADGTFNGRVEVEGCFSFELGGDSASRMGDIPRQLKQARENCGSEGYKERIRNAEIVSVNLGDKLRYTGLVMVAQGLRRMLDESAFVPEVIGKYFQDIYQKLPQQS